MFVITPSIDFHNYIWLTKITTTNLHSEKSENQTERDFSLYFGVNFREGEILKSSTFRGGGLLKYDLDRDVPLRLEK